jgi:aspartyl aminopeptidase
VAKARDKKELDKLRERLTVSPRLVWDHVDDAERQAIMEYAERYKMFLDAAKTEREAVTEIESQARARGFVPLMGSAPGVPWFYTYKGKTIALGVPGRRPLTEGLRIIGAHIDSPRLDLKQYPLYEDTDLVFLKTHYYGGIKKYQWLARPLALHGVVLKADGSVVEFRVGEEPGDPVFTVLDLLPHLARKVQMDKKVSEAFEGEKLNVLVGSLPIGDKDTKERFKLFLLKYLEDTYGLTEEDLVSAELEVVPAGPARDVGWDRSLVGAYGQDDRSCAYPALEAILALKDPEYAAIALFYDKEEVGSDGNTSAKSCLLEDMVELLLEREGMSPLARRRVLMNSLPSPGTSPGPSTPTIRKSTKNGTPPAWATASPSPSTPATAANTAPMTRTPNISPGSGRSSMTPGSSGRPAISARWTKAGAAPSPSTWRCTAWKSSTRGRRSCPCTRLSRWPPRPTSTWCSRPTGPFSRRPGGKARFSVFGLRFSVYNIWHGKVWGALPAPISFLPATTLPPGRGRVRRLGRGVQGSCSATQGFFFCCFRPV